jgi:branched-chain amino acid transport system substrate-binding protein
MNTKHLGGAIWLALTCAMGIAAAAADKQYGPGVSDSEIKIGQTTPYSGPASAYSIISKTQLGYVRMINERGGINGRKIRLISLEKLSNKHAG